MTGIKETQVAHLGESRGKADFDTVFAAAKQILGTFDVDAVRFFLDGISVHVTPFTSADEAYAAFVTSRDDVGADGGCEVDSEGHFTADQALCCPYCGRGEIAPILEYTGYAHSEHRDWTGTVCDHCLAEWNQDGTPRKGSHRATLAIEAARRTRG